MNNKLTTFLLFILLGLGTSTAFAEKKWDLKVSDNSRFLEYTDGTPFFWLGDTGWLLPQRLDQNEAGGYLTRAAEMGFNVVQVQVINGVPATNIYGQYSNNPDDPWNFSCFKASPQPSPVGRESKTKSQKTKGKGQTTNTHHLTPTTPKLTMNYWDHLDYIVKLAEGKGIYIAMDCIWGGLVKSGTIDVNGAKAYGKFLAERYKDSPNIIWMIGGDIPGDIHPEIWEALATTIKSIDKRHLMTYHPRGRYTSAKWWAKADWIDFHMYQSGHRAYGQRMGNKDYPIPDNTEENCWMYVDSTWNYKPVKPVVDGEPSYEDIPIGLHFPTGPRWQASDVRRYAYWDVFAGAFGHTYGHNAIMQMAKPGYGVAYAQDAVTWYEAQKAPGYTQMRYLKGLMLALPFFERMPDQSIIASGNGERYERLIATRGNDYLLVYNYTSRDMNVDLTKISGDKKNVWWMDAKTGDLQYLGEQPSKTLTFRPTSEDSGINDGVLIAIDATKSYLSKEQQNILTPVEVKSKSSNAEE